MKWLFHGEKKFFPRHFKVPYRAPENKNFDENFRFGFKKLLHHFLGRNRIVQGITYQKMGQIGQEMTELCRFYRNFEIGPQNFQKSKNSKRVPEVPNTFLADLVFVLSDLMVFDPIFTFLESFLNDPKILKFRKTWKTWYRKTIRPQLFLVRFCSPFDMLFLIQRATNICGY